MRVMIRIVLFCAFMSGALAVHLSSPLAPVSNLIAWGCCLICYFLADRK